MAVNAPLLLPQNELTGVGASPGGFDFSYTDQAKNWSGGLPRALTGSDGLPIPWTAHQLWLYAATQGLSDTATEEAYRLNHFRVWPGALGFAGAAGALLRLPKVIICDFAVIENYQSGTFAGLVFDGLEASLSAKGVAVWAPHPLDNSYFIFPDDPAEVPSFFTPAFTPQLSSNFALGPGLLLPHLDWSTATDTGGVDWADAVSVGGLANSFAQPYRAFTPLDWYAGEVLYLSCKTFNGKSSAGLLGDGLLGIHFASLETVNFNQAHMDSLLAAKARHARFGYHAVLDMDSEQEGVDESGFNDDFWFPWRALAISVFDSFMAAAGPETQSLVTIGSSAFSPAAVAQAVASFRARVQEFWNL